MRHLGLRRRRCGRPPGPGTHRGRCRNGGAIIAQRPSLPACPFPHVPSACPFPQRKTLSGPPGGSYTRPGTRGAADETLDLRPFASRTPKSPYRTPTGCLPRTQPPVTPWTAYPLLCRAECLRRRSSRQVRAAPHRCGRSWPSAAVCSVGMTTWPQPKGGCDEKTDRAVPGAARDRDSTLETSADPSPSAFLSSHSLRPPNIATASRRWRQSFSRSNPGRQSEDPCPSPPGVEVLLEASVGVISSELS